MYVYADERQSECININSKNIFSSFNNSIHRFKEKIYVKPE